MNVKYSLALCALASAATFVPRTQARLHHVYYLEDPLFDTTWFDDMLDFQRHSIQAMRQQWADLGPSKEQREAMKAARENLQKIKTEIKEEDGKIVINFSGFEKLDKNDVKVVKKDNGWLGTITTKDGSVEFYIAPHGIQVSRRIELKKEEKADKKDEKDSKSERTFYSSSVSSEGEYFKQLIDINSLKAEPIKNNSFTLTAHKQKEEALVIS